MILWGTCSASSECSATLNEEKEDTVNRRRNSQILAGAAATALAIGLAGCSSEPADDAPVEIRFTWWGGDERHELTNEALDAFEEANPNITVVRDFGGFDGYLDKITTQYAGGNSPDVIQLYNEVLVEFADRGQLYDLNDAVEAGELSLTGWPQDVIDMNTVDDELAALTFGSNTHGFIFDETKSAEFGVPIPSDGYSWDDLQEYSAAVTDASGGTMWGTFDLSHSYQVFEVWAKQHGEEFLTADGIGFTQDTLEEYWQYWADMRDGGAVPSPDVSTEYLGTPYDAVLQGVVASTFLFTNQFASVADSTPDELTIARMPSETPTPGQYLRAAMNLTVSAQTEHPEAAARLVNFLLNDAEANAILGTDRGFPSNEDVFEAATADLSGPATAAAEIYGSVREDGSPAPVPAPAGSGAVNTLFSEFAQQIQFGQISVSDAASQFLAQAEAELS
ncbi:ABC transporter substrate-binding protein [Microbacterium sp. I2]|uniref:ABC transporter substrate-binding protein n=1 Tax=Microbacterium sp. I2 TaxID=3391826 RepID=UPI003F523D50